MRKIAWLRNADMLLAISNHTKQEAVDALGIPSARIAVIHAGVDPSFQPVPVTPRQRHQLLARYGIGEKFLLY
jgi:hypothetical protein